MGKITVLYFAAAITAAGTTSETVDIPATADGAPFLLSALADVLISLHPGSNLDKVLKTSQWSVDAEMVDDPAQCVLKGDEEVAVICPVSGG